MYDKDTTDCMYMSVMYIYCVSLEKKMALEFSFRPNNL